MTSKQNPYDTGEALEPFPWVSDADQARDRVHGTSGHRYGKVDFDDDTGTTRATVYAERREDGQYMMIIDNLLTGKTHAILLGEALD